MGPLLQTGIELGAVTGRYAHVRHLAPLLAHARIRSMKDLSLYSVGYMVAGVVALALVLKKVLLQMPSLTSLLAVVSEVRSSSSETCHGPPATTTLSSCLPRSERLNEPKSSTNRTDDQVALVLSSSTLPTMLKQQLPSSLTTSMADDLLVSAMSSIATRTEEMPWKPMAV